MRGHTSLGSTPSRRRVLKSVGGTAVSALVTGHARPNSTRAQESDFPDTFTIGTPSPASPIWEFAAWPAFQNRIEQEFGSTVERKVFQGFTPLVSAFIRNEVDMGYVSLASLVKAKHQGLPIIAPMGYAQQYIFPLITSPSISSWSDLRGKKVAVHSPSAVSTATARVMVKEELGNEDAVEYQNILGTPNRLSALESGNVDAASVFLSGALQAEKSGNAKILAKPWKYDRLATQTTVLWGVSERSLDQNPDLFSGVVNQMKRSYEWLYETKPETIVDQALSTGIFPEFSEDVWLETFEQVRSHNLWARNGNVQKRQLRKAQDVLVSTGLIEERIPRNEIVTERFL